MENEKNSKLEIFKQDFTDEKKFEINLEKLFQSILEEKYTNEIYSNEKFFSMFLSVNKIFEKKI